MSVIPTRHYALRTPHLIGRTTETDRIQRAVKDWLRSYAFYFYGPGGIGKTRLLEEIGDRIKQVSFSTRLVGWSGIIDLYLSGMHSNSGIEKAICEAIDPDREYFAHYWDMRSNFEHQHREHMDAHQREMLRTQLAAAFIGAFNTLAGKTRVVLTFDTVELIQYENDLIQTICQVQEEAITVKTWLLETLPQLNNTVIIFAGRPKSMKLDADLRAAFADKSDWCYAAYELAGFDEAETAYYFQEII
ncbi:MAG: ATP-binding protein, partial [Anaerolineae bacterium]